MSVRSIDDVLFEPEPEPKSEPKSDLKSELKLKPESKPEPSEKSESFLIEVPPETNNGVMKNLKELLLRNKGDTPVSISLNTANKRIKLPFGVNLTSELRKSVDSLLK